MNTPPFSPHHPLRIFIFFSGNATAVRWLRHTDPGYNFVYTVEGALTNNKSAPGIAFFEKHTNNTDNTTKLHPSHKKESISCQILDWKTFQGENRENKREEYFMELLKILKPYDFDIIVCSGFHLKIPDFFIQHLFPIQIINTHPADLNIIDTSTGKRSFVGLWRHAIQAALHARMEDSCSTAHYITAGDDIDGGEIIAQSQRFKLIPNENPKIVQERMALIGSDGQALQRALHIISHKENPSANKLGWFKKIFKTLFYKA